MTDKLERFYLNSKGKTADARPLRAYVQWLKNNPGAKLTFQEYVIADCDLGISNDKGWLIWKCQDKSGPFLISRYIYGDGVGDL